MESTTLNNQNRIEWIDIAKGIGILCVVLGHIYIPYLYSFVYLFHMPLFFFLSGLCSSSKGTLQSRIIKKIKSLYIPMIVSELLFIFLNFFLVRCHFIGNDSLVKFDDIVDVLRFIVNLLVGNYDLLSPLWFLRNLLIVSILCCFFDYFIIKCPNEKSKKIISFIILCLFVITAFITTQFSLFYGVKSLDAVFLSFCYYWLGYNLRFIKQINWRRNIKFKISLIIVLLLILVFLSRYVKVDMYFNNFSNFWLSVLSAILGIVFVYLISTLFIDNKIRILKLFLIYIGQRTLWIFALHFYGFKIANAIIVSLFKMDIENRMAFPVISWKYAPLYFILGLLVPLSLEFIFNKLKSLGLR